MATRGVGSIFEPLALIVQQQLPCHLCTTGSRLGPSQRCSEERGVPSEYIQRFCNKRNVISEVDDKLIVMFFKKGLRDSTLI
jgi:hypothetical protein